MMLQGISTRELQPRYNRVTVFDGSGNCERGARCLDVNPNELPGQAEAEG